MTAAPRYILYTRVSTQAQDDNNSHESQLAALVTHTQRRSGQVAHVFRETESGGSYLKRKELLAALELLESDLADVLCCYDFSRYSRDRKHQEMIRERVHAAGKRIEFTTFDLQYDENGELTPDSGLMADISGDFAKYHRAKIRADTMRGAKTSAEKGIQPRRRSPYGYHIVNTADKVAERYPGQAPGQYVVVESEAAIVREMFERRASGQTFVQILKWLDEQGILTRRGAAWTNSDLSHIFENSVHKGEATYGRTRRVNDESRLERGFKRDFSYKKRQPREVTIIPVTPIVSPDIWNAVAAMRTSMPRNRLANTSALGDSRARFLLSSVLKCPRCGGPMIGKTQQRSARGSQGRTGRPKKGESAPPAPREKQRFYVCRYSQMDKRARRCLARHYPAQPLDERILKLLLELVDDREMLIALLHQGAPGSDAEELAALERELETIGARERLLIEAQLKAMLEGLDTSTYETMLRETGTQRAGLQERLKVLRGQQHARIGASQEAHLHRQLSNVRALLLDGESLQPLSQPLQTLHNLLKTVLERIDFEEPERGVIGTVKVVFR